MPRPGTTIASLEIERGYHRFSSFTVEFTSAQLRVGTTATERIAVQVGAQEWMGRAIVLGTIGPVEFYLDHRPLSRMHSVECTKCPPFYDVLGTLMAVLIAVVVLVFAACYVHDLPLRDASTDGHGCEASCALAIIAKDCGLPQSSRSSSHSSESPSIPSAYGIKVPEEYERRAGY